MAKVALLIGVSDYEPGLEPLPSAVKDITAMQEVLANPDMGEFAATDITVLANPDRQTMEDAIYRLFAHRQKEDLVLLYFSGHGVVDEGGEFYFTSRVTRKDQGRLVPTTAVAARSVQTWMEQSRCQRQVIILDSCFSGAFAKGVKAKDSGSVNLGQCLGGKGRAILTASTSTQYALAQEGLDLSVYTHYLVEGIRIGGADLDDDGFIAVEELHTYASGKVKEAAPAMTPEIYPVKEGYKILLAKSPKDVKKLNQQHFQSRSPSPQKQFTYTFSVHSDTVGTVAFSPNGKMIVSGSQDGSIKVWDPSNKTLLKTFLLDQATVYAISISFDSQLLVSGNHDSTINIWDLNSFNQLKSFKNDSTAITAITFTHDKKRLIYGTNAGTINEIDVETGHLVKPWPSHRDGVRGICLSHDGKYFASCGNDKKVKISKLNARNSTRTLPHKARVNSVNFSPDGRLIATCSNDKDASIQIWDLTPLGDSKRPELLKTIKCSDVVHSVIFTPNSKNLVIGTNDNKVEVWDISSRKRKLLHSLQEHAGAVRSVAVSPDGQTIASASSDRTVRIWYGYLNQDFGTGALPVSSVKNSLLSPDLSVEKSNFAKAMKIFEPTLFSRGISLKEDQKAVLWGAWLGKTYLQMAEETSHAPSYLQNVGSRLWKLISDFLGEKVTKENFRSVLEKKPNFWKKI